MSIPATTLHDALELCKASPLTQSEDDRKMFVAMDDARDDERSFRKSLKRYVQSTTPQKVLAYGHRGCGKSTELNCLVSELGDDYLTVQVLQKDYLAYDGNQAADVLLAACIQLVKVASDEGLAVNEQSLIPIYKFFSETTKTETREREANLGLSGEAKAGTGLLGKLAQIFGVNVEANVGIKGELKTQSGSEETQVFQVRKYANELVILVNSLATAVQQAWQKKRGKDARLLFIFEDFDKLSLKDAEHIFINEGKLLAEFNQRAIFTIPVFLRHSSKAPYLKSQFDVLIALPMIKTYGKDLAKYDKGWELLRKLVRARVADNVLPDDALDILIERTGGVLRNIFEAIQKAGDLNSVQSAEKISAEGINKALDRMIGDIGLQISYPRDWPGDRDPKPLQQHLAAAAKAQDAGKPWPVEAHPHNELLLMSTALIEYNGEGWLGVHPLARDYLKKLNLL